MFLLRKIIISENGSEIILKNGIEVFATGKGFICSDSFWGDTLINIDSEVDYLKKFEKTNIRGGIRISKVTSFSSYDTLNGFKKFIFNITNDENTKNHGYIVFIKRSVKYEKIKTTGTILFDLYPHEIVVLLKNGQSMKTDELEIRNSLNQFILVK